MALACDFMRQAQRGDYFQMSAKYEYGTGAHSAIMLGYDPETDEIHWMDSNMRGGKKKGIRYGLVQFDEVKSVAWWASTFCKKTRGATLYRLRDDIVYRPGHEPENTTGGFFALTASLPLSALPESPPTGLSSSWQRGLRSPACAEAAESSGYRA